MDPFVHQLQLIDLRGVQLVLRNRNNVDVAVLISITKCE
jgi:hypothetical protein